MPDVIKFKCKACDKKIAVRATYAGKKEKCPGCHQPLRVPDADASQSQGLTAPAPDPIRGLSDLQESDDEIVQAITRLCASCGSKQPNDAVVCIACGTDLQTGKKLKTVVKTNLDSSDAAPAAQYVVAPQHYITVGALMIAVAACYILLKLIQSIGNADRSPGPSANDTSAWLGVTFAFVMMAPAAALIWISRQKPIDLRQKKIRIANYVAGGALALLSVCLCLYSIDSYEWSKGITYQGMFRRLLCGIVMILGGAKLILDGALGRSCRIGLR